MDERTHATIPALVALNTRRITALERALELVVRYLGNETMADELHAIAVSERDDPAASLYWRLARLARRQR